MEMCTVLGAACRFERVPGCRLKRVPCSVNTLKLQAAPFTVHIPSF
jgi:hypothetical protein